MRQAFAKRGSWAALALALMAWCCQADAADAYPKGPIRLVAPSGPGLMDMLARAVADKMAKQLGATVIVDNKTGAGGNIGADAVAKAPPDGLTLLFADSGILTLNDRLYQNLPYNAKTDFEPISLIAKAPMVLVVPSTSKLKSVSDLVEAARARPGQLFYASAGKGTGGQVAMQMLEFASKAALTHVPYKGSGDAATAVATAQVDALFNNVMTLNPYLQSAKVRAIGVASASPLDALPGVPTIASSGLPGFEASAWFGVVAPKGTPPEILRRLESAIVQGMNDPAIRKQFNELGVTLVATSSADFARTLDLERGRVAEVADTGAFRGD